MRNSVLEGLREKKLEDVQLDTLAIVCSRYVMLCNPELRMIREVK